MDSQAFISQVGLSLNERLSNKDIFSTDVEFLEIFADHLNICDLCRYKFDSQGFTELTVLELVKKLTLKSIDDWICKDRQPRDIHGRIKRTTGENPRRRLSKEESDLIDRFRSTKNFYIMELDDQEEYDLQKAWQHYQTQAMKGRPAKDKTIEEFIKSSFKEVLEEYLTLVD